MISDEAKRIIDALPRDELLLEISKRNRSRFSNDNYAYLQARLRALEAQEVAENRNNESAHRKEGLRLDQDANDLARRANEIARHALRWSKGAVAVAILVPAIAWMLSAFSPGVLRWRGAESVHSWRPLIAGQTSFSKQAFLSDMPMPGVGKIVGKFKFVDNTDSAVPHSVKLGYRINVDVAPLNLTKVPEMCREPKKIDLGAGKVITQLPLTQSSAIAEIHFDFRLKDRDGFTIMTVHGETETLWAGKANVFQHLVNAPVTWSVARRTAGVVEDMTIERLTTC